MRLLAEPAFQARLQSIASLVFALGGAIGQLWGGVALDQFGMMGLIGGAAVLGALSVGVLLRQKSQGVIPSLKSLRL